jgi:RNAse (barnase) inhibitor barstar
MTVLELDGARFATLEEFYEEVGRVLVPGVEWGKNLDAFNDILRGGFGAPTGGFMLRWKNHRLSRVRLGYAETVRQLESRLLQGHPSNHADVSAKLAEATAQRGTTVFDWLCEIIRDHGRGGRQAGDGVELVLA